MKSRKESLDELWTLANACSDLDLQERLRALHRAATEQEYWAAVDSGDVRRHPDYEAVRSHLPRAFSDDDIAGILRLMDERSRKRQS
jgi:hypothetical protein